MYGWRLLIGFSGLITLFIVYLGRIISVLVILALATALQISSILEEWKNAGCGLKVLPPPESPKPRGRATLRR